MTRKFVKRSIFLATRGGGPDAVLEAGRRGEPTPEAPRPPGEPSWVPRPHTEGKGPGPCCTAAPNPAPGTLQLWPPGPRASPGAHPTTWGPPPRSPASFDTPCGPPRGQSWTEERVPGSGRKAAPDLPGPLAGLPPRAQIPNPLTRVDSTPYLKLRCSDCVTRIHLFRAGGTSKGAKGPSRRRGGPRSQVSPPRKVPRPAGASGLEPRLQVGALRAGTPTEVCDSRGLGSSLRPVPT